MCVKTSEQHISFMAFHGHNSIKMFMFLTLQRIEKFFFNRFYIEFDVTIELQKLSCFMHLDICNHLKASLTSTVFMSVKESQEALCE